MHGHDQELIWVTYPLLPQPQPRPHPRLHALPHPHLHPSPHPHPLPLQWKTTVILCWAKKFKRSGSCGRAGRFAAWIRSGTQQTQTKRIDAGAHLPVVVYRLESDKTQQLATVALVTTRILGNPPHLWSNGWSYRQVQLKSQLRDDVQAMVSGRTNFTSLDMQRSITSTYCVAGHLNDKLH